MALSIRKALSLLWPIRDESQCEETRMGIRNNFTLAFRKSKKNTKLINVEEIRQVNMMKIHGIEICGRYLKEITVETTAQYSNKFDPDLLSRLSLQLFSSMRFPAQSGHRNAGRNWGSHVLWFPVIASSHSYIFSLFSISSRCILQNVPIQPLPQVLMISKTPTTTTTTTLATDSDARSEFVLWPSRPHRGNSRRSCYCWVRFFSTEYYSSQIRVGSREALDTTHVIHYSSAIFRRIADFEYDSEGLLVFSDIILYLFLPGGRDELFSARMSARIHASLMLVFWRGNGWATRQWFYYPISVWQARSPRAKLSVRPRRISWGPRGNRTGEWMSREWW